MELLFRVHRWVKQFGCIFDKLHSDQGWMTTEPNWQPEIIWTLKISPVPRKEFIPIFHTIFVSFELRETKDTKFLILIKYPYHIPNIYIMQQLPVILQIKHIIIILCNMDS